MKEEYTYELDGAGDVNTGGSWKPIKYVINECGCWVCVSHSKFPNGYTQLRRKGRNYKLHRLVYEKEVGPIPPGLIILHSCDDPACFNPSHLSAGTFADNSADMVAKGRSAKPIGVANGFSKLTDEIVRSIRLDNRTPSVIAADYGINPVTVWHVKNRKTWKHVD